MELKLSYFNESINKCFLKIMTEPSYRSTGLRRYRVFIYIYIFGCTHVRDLAYIFYDDLDNLRSKSDKELFNMHRSMLNFFCKDKMLIKLEDNFYTLGNTGIKELYNHLLTLNLMENVDQKTFQSNFVKITAHLSHSSKSGRTTLSYVQHYNEFFLTEPIFDSDGNLFSGGLLHNSIRAVSPDAVISCDDGERYYIEADSSAERINSFIIPKLKKYTSFVFSHFENTNSSTLHFSIWNYKKNDYSFPSYLHEIDRISSLHEFISNEMGIIYSFYDYYEFLYNYKGTFAPATELSDILNSYNHYNVTSSEELLFKIKIEHLNSFYTKEFLTRKKSLFNHSTRIPSFVECLLKGTRFVCLPFHSYNELFDLIYIEQFSSHKKLFNILFNKSNNYQFISYKKTHCFLDEITGENYYFRNVFKYKNNDKTQYIILENISDELGGRLRVKKFYDAFKNSISIKIRIFCIYNNYLDIEPISLISNRPNRNISLEFLTYEEILAVK